jgi:hypothetical protein
VVGHRPLGRRKLAERLDALEADCNQQRRAWVVKAAEHAGWHIPGDATKLLDLAGISTSAEADRAVAAVTREHPYLAVERISEAEQRRRWGAEILDAIDRA